MVWIVLAVLSLLYVVLAGWAVRASRRTRVHVAASEYAALHDHVTELPNRVLFHGRVHQAVKLAARTTCAPAASKSASARPMWIRCSRQNAHPKWRMNMTTSGPSRQRSRNSTRPSTLSTFKLGNSSPGARGTRYRVDRASGTRRSTRGRAR